MEFKDQLNEYIKELGCTTKELAEACNLGTSTLERYRSGARVPGRDSEQLKKLAAGLTGLAAAKEAAGWEQSEILNAFTATMEDELSPEVFSANLDYIITKLNVNVSNLAKTLNYDASFLSRIRSGNRMPSDPVRFVHDFADYILHNYDAAGIAGILEKQADREGQEPFGEKNIKEKLGRFLLNTTAVVPEYASNFLRKLDDFDLNEYIRSIRFDELKVPSVPFQFPSSKEYFGVEGQKQAELDFLKGSALSKAKAELFLCSDMDMTEMAKDMDFSKKWMFGLAALLKKGRTIHIIHNLNRPFGELMLGLESWIPLYMTGQVVPFYIQGIHNGFYQHILYTSGNFALSGECIKGFHEKGKYVVTNNREEVRYCEERANCILKKAHSLMDIYTEEKQDKFFAFYGSMVEEKGNRHYLCSSLPVFLLSDDFLSAVLEKNQLSREEIKRLLSKVDHYRKATEKWLAEYRLLLEIPDYSKEEFEKYPGLLDMTAYGCYKQISYSYEEYCAHIRAAVDFAKAHENCTVKLCKDFAFRNINIRILEGKSVWISKINAPIMHFVIRYPQLREAIENMYIPVYDF